MENDKINKMNLKKRDWVFTFAEMILDLRMTFSVDHLYAFVCIYFSIIFYCFE